MGRLCRGAHEISGIHAQFCSWGGVVVMGFMGWVLVVGWVLFWLMVGWVGHVGFVVVWWGG